MVGYIPDQGDIVWVNFDPQVGREIQKRRPALILSLKEYNKIRRMALVVPITSKTKGYPLEVPLKTPQITGFVLSDQIKAIDWKERDVQYITTSPQILVEETLKNLNLLFGIDLEQ